MRDVDGAFEAISQRMLQRRSTCALHDRIPGTGRDMLGHGAGILLIDVERSDLHIDQRGLDIGSAPSSCMSAGRLTPARTMSEAKVCRNRCGLASLTPVVRR